MPHTTRWQVVRKTDMGGEKSAALQALFYLNHIEVSLPEVLRTNTAVRIWE